MDVRENMVELSDIQVLQREIECVKRKSATNCADCLNCDLLMTDERILSAYANAIDAMQNANGVTVQECGRWKYFRKQNIAVCTNCSFERDLDANFGKAIACPNCGAYMRQSPKGE